jgi:hypothetical protein
MSEEAVKFFSFSIQGAASVNAAPKLDNLVVGESSTVLMDRCEGLGSGVSGIGDVVCLDFIPLGIEIWKSDVCFQRGNLNRNL